MEQKNGFAEKVDPEDFALGTLAMDDKKLVRKIDWQILPIMFLTYFLQMIDKIAINVSLYNRPLGTAAKDTSMQMSWVFRMIWEWPGMISHGWRRLSSSLMPSPRSPKGLFSSASQLRKFSEPMSFAGALSSVALRRRRILPAFSHSAFCLA